MVDKRVMNEDLKSKLVKIGKDAGKKASHILSMANEDTKNSALKKYG